MDLSRRRLLRVGTLAAAAVPLAALTPGRAPAAPQTVVDHLPSGASLTRGDSLVSTSGRFRLHFYTDGGVALLDGTRQIWLVVSGARQADRLVVAPSGDVQLLAGSALVWHTGSDRAAGAVLRVQDDGNVAVLFGEQAVWSRLRGLYPFAPYHPLALAHVGHSRQVLVVAGSSPTSTYATAYPWERGGDGLWHLAWAPMAARSGYGGWVWAAARRQGDGASPAGTFTLTEAYGLAPTPGTAMPYTQVGSDDYRSGDPADPRTYNLHQDSPNPHRTWRVSGGTAERYADYPVQYQHLVNIDVDTPLRSTVSFDRAHGQYVTSQPVGVGRGFALYLHMDGAGDTAGCISLPADQLTQVVRWLDPQTLPRIVLAPIGWLSAA